MSSETTGRRAELAPLVILAGLIVLALVLRFLRLGDWGLEATEMFTLRDSVRPQFHNARPLGYLFNYYLVRPFHPLDELGLRVMPAVFSVLAVPAFYFVTRRLVGTRAALFAALLVTVSALQVYYAQFARYWSLVFLLSAIYPYLLYMGIRQRHTGMIVLGSITLVLAVLAHPVAALLLGGPAIWLLIVYARPRYLQQAWRYQSFRWGVAIAALLAVGLAWRLVPMLQGWVTMHDKNPGSGQFLLAPKLPTGPKQIMLLMAYFESLTFPVVLAGAAGIYLLWRERDRTLGLYLATLAIFPLTFIALVSIRTPASTFYLLPAAPVFYIGAGVLLERLFQVDWKLRPQWLIPATITVALLTAGLPTLVSQYSNGRRFDFRGVAHWLRPQITPQDVFFSDQPMVLAHYLGGPTVQKLRSDPAQLGESLSRLEQSGDGGHLWVVAPAASHAFRTNLKPGGLARWLFDNCQLRNTVGTGRIDFRQQYLHVFRCPLR